MAGMVTLVPVPLLGRPAVSAIYQPKAIAPVGALPLGTAPDAAVSISRGQRPTLAFAPSTATSYGTSAAAVTAAALAAAVGAARHRPRARTARCAAAGEKGGTRGSSGNSAATPRRATAAAMPAATAGTGEKSSADECLTLLGVLGLVPDAYWLDIPQEQRERLAGQMARHRTDGLATWRYVLALLGMVLVSRAFCGAICVVFAALGGQGADWGAIWSLPMQGFLGWCLLQVVLVSTEPPRTPLEEYGSHLPRAASVRVSSWPPPRPLTPPPGSPPLAAPHLRREIEALERMWRL